MHLVHLVCSFFLTIYSSLDLGIEMSATQLSEEQNVKSIKKPEAHGQPQENIKPKDKIESGSEKKDQNVASKPDTSKNAKDPEKKDPSVDADGEKPKGEDSQNKDEPEKSIGLEMKIIMFIIIALGLIFAILQLAYYIYYCVELSDEEKDIRFHVDVFMFVEIRNRTGHDPESTRSYLFAFVITSVVVDAIYIIIHCVLIFGAIKENMWICIAWCITVTVCIVTRIIIIAIVPLAMFTYMGIEMVFEIIWIGFIVFVILQIRKNQKENEKKDEEGDDAKNKDPDPEKHKRDPKKSDKNKTPKTNTDKAKKNNKISPSAPKPKNPAPAKKDPIPKEQPKEKVPSESQQVQKPEPQPNADNIETQATSTSPPK